MRSVVLALAAVALMAESPPPPQVQQFEQALAGSRLADAAAALDKLIEQRTPTDGKPHPDPLLNALFGRFYLAAHEAGAAVIYLDRAPLQELPGTLRAATALAHGHALELRGDRAAALAAYREAAATADSDSGRRRATLGIARQLLPENPSAVRPELGAIAGGAPTAERWRAKYLLAASASLTGDRQTAERLADEAWADALYAPLSDLATLHVATLRAGLAAARHDQAAERAMLIASNGLSLSASSALSAQLPICGDRGITQSDYVIFGYVAGPYATLELLPIAASRTEAVVPFADSLAGNAPIMEADGFKPLGTVFTVACRSSVHPYFASKPMYDPLLDWFVERGLYPASASYDAEDRHLNAIAERINTLATRFGQSSPLLIVPRWQMMILLENRASAGDTVLPGQLSDLSKQIAGGMRQAAAPEWLAQTVESRVSYEQAAETAPDDPAQLSAMQDVLRTFLLRIPINFARELIAEGTNSFHGDWPAPYAQLVVDLKPNAASLTGRERQAWLLMLAQAQRTLGLKRDAVVTISTAGLPNDLCARTDAEPALLDQKFSYKDYPEDFIAGEQEGAVMFDFALSPSGNVARRRIVYSLPSGLFDEPSAKGLATVRYTAPRKGGKAVACDGVYQPIVWRLEGEHDFSLPRLAPELSDKVS
ncbi:energy transducer TonB [Sphingomonas sp.]|uniref:energy transducer TonB n=1 Tax=Sphingomonas sp. TaxID=28214 RepID=UPI0038A255B6